MEVVEVWEDITKRQEWAKIQGHPFQPISMVALEAVLAAVLEVVLEVEFQAVWVEGLVLVAWLDPTHTTPTINKIVKAPKAA